MRGIESRSSGRPADCPFGTLTLLVVFVIPPGMAQAASGAFPQAASCAAGAVPAEQTMPSDPDFTPVVRLANLPLGSYERGTAYRSSDAEGVGVRLGLTRLGATYTEVPPGKSSCPYHVHHAVDEMFVILEGEGEYRFGNRRYRVAAGDVLGAPRGGADFAHKLTNTGAGTLRYLGISSAAEADVCEYPDSGKFAAQSSLGFGIVGRQGAGVDYWDGEPDDPR